MDDATLSSRGSDESDSFEVSFRGDSAFADVRVFRSPLLDEFEEAEEWCEFEFCCVRGRERMERRGDVPAIVGAGESE